MGVRGRTALSSMAGFGGSEDTIQTPLLPVCGSLTGRPENYNHKRGG